MNNNMLSFKKSLLSTRGSITILLREPAPENVFQNDSFLPLTLLFLCWKTEKVAIIVQEVKDGETLNCKERKIPYNLIT